MADAESSNDAFEPKAEEANASINIKVRIISTPKP